MKYSVRLLIIMTALLLAGCDSTFRSGDITLAEGDGGRVSLSSAVASAPLIPKRWNSPL